MKVEFARLRRAVAFRVTLLVFLALNAGSWIRFQFFAETGIGQSSFGYPFPIRINDGFEATSNFYLLGLLLDIAIALTVAVLVTWLVAIATRNPES